MPILSPAICRSPAQPSHTLNPAFATATVENGPCRSDRQTHLLPKVDHSCRPHLRLNSLRATTPTQRDENGIR